MLSTEAAPSRVVTPSSVDSELRVFLICAGLGSVPRGFESFSEECFLALRRTPGVRVTLFQGAGEPELDRKVLTKLSPDGWLTRALAKLTRRQPVSVEQISFAIPLLAHIMSARPAVIYFSEPALGQFLWHCRRLLRADFRLLLSNGGPVPWSFHYWDHAQQLTPTMYADAIEAGWEGDRQTFVPYGIDAHSSEPVLDPAQRKLLRKRLNLPVDRKIVLSVAALDRSHKRLDYLITEHAELPEPRPFLLLLGAPTPETPMLLDLARQSLGEDGFAVRTVPYSLMAHYYACADVVVHCALHEGFGRVFLEALLHGAPCIAHDYAGARYVLGEHASYFDMRQPGLARELKQALDLPLDTESMLQRRNYVRRMFDWSVLTPDYRAMLRRCASQPVKRGKLHDRLRGTP